MTLLHAPSLALHSQSQLWGCGGRGEQPPRCGVGASSSWPVFWALQSWILRPVRLPVAGPFFRVPGVWGRVSALPTTGFRTSPGQLALILSRPGPDSCSCRLFFSPCCCGFCILESFCFGFSGASGQSELDHVFSLPFYRRSQNSLDSAPNP